MDPQTHYDLQACCARPSSARQRALGPAFPLKQYHNAIKRRLLEAFVRPGNVVVDLACGRGGDLRKWVDVGASRVIGVDISAAALQEARARWHALQKPLPCEFHHVTTLTVAPWEAEVPADVVTCMFALHYFFGTEHAAKTFLHTVAHNLKDGGYFVCVVPDGRRVNMWLLEGRADPLVTVTPTWTGPPQPFGSSYVCSIEDTVTEGCCAEEYLVYENVVVSLAATVGLEPVTQLPAECMEFLEESSGTFKHFKPRFGASGLFAACVLQKRDRTAPEPGGESLPDRPAYFGQNRKRPRKPAHPLKRPRP